MAINYPTTTDSFVNPNATDDTSVVSHSTQHANHNEAIMALENKVGPNSSTDPITHDFKLSGVATGDRAASRAGTETLTNKTLTAPTITGTITTLGGSIITNTSGTVTLPNATDTLVGKATTDTLTNKTLTNPTITNGNITNPTITKPAMSATNPTAQTYTPAAAGTATLDLALSNQHYITMPAGNITIALTGDTNNQVFIVKILQDGVGSRTVTWFSTIKWAGGTVPTLTTTANKADMFGFIRTGSNAYDGFIVGQNI